MGKEKLQVGEISKPRFEFRSFGQNFNDQAARMARLSVPIPEKLWSIVILPKYEVNTRDAREMLPNRVSLKSAVEQAGNLSGFTLWYFLPDGFTPVKR